MEYLLVSACLLGQAVRYNGGDKRVDHELLVRWLAEGRVLPFCPEVAGGLPVPRLPAEIQGPGGGLAVLEGRRRVRDKAGVDVTAAFVEGASQALALARENGVRVAVMKEGSPSCGSSYSYDGSFSGSRLAVPGVATALLRQAGVQVFSESELAEADALLRRIEAGQI